MIFIVFHSRLLVALCDNIGYFSKGLLVTMAVEVPSSKANDTNSTESSTFHKSSIFLLMRSYEDARIVFTFILTTSAVVIILGIIVNSVISYIMLRKKRYKRNGSNFFIMHLSVVELLYRFLVFPIIVIFAIPAIGITDIQCKAIAFFSKTCSTVIFGSLVAIAIDRYQNIVHPLQKLKSRRKPVLLVSLLWLCATVLSCPFVASVESISVLEIPEARGMSCNECAHKKICDIPQNVLGHSSTTLYFLCAFVVPLMIISVLYIKVAIFLHQRSNNGMMNRVAARSRTKAVRMLVLIVLGYVFSLGPSVFLAMLRSFGVLNNLSFDVMLLVSWMAEFAAFTSSLGNPIIYAYYNGDFRKEFVRLFPKRGTKRLILAH